MHRLICVLVLGLLAASSAQGAISRTYVASYGADSNTTFSCDFAHPCRSFQAAFSQVTDGGEIVAIDGSGYGPIIIDRSVAIIANPGAFAGIGVFSGAGITIATAGIRVTLRGITINGQGGTYGISMTNGAKLSIENCVIANFSGASQSGVYVSTAATVRVVDSLFRDNHTAVNLTGGATASISGSRFFGSYLGVAVTDTPSTTTVAFIDRSVASGGSYGFSAESFLGGAVRLSITESVVTRMGSFAVDAQTIGGAAEVSVSNSLLSENAVGVLSSGAGAKVIASGNTITRNVTGMNQASSGVLRSAGDNVVDSNTTNTFGTITTFARM